MQFMRVIRKGEYYPCAYFIDGKRVSYDAYREAEIKIDILGDGFDCLHTTSTKNTWQHRKSGRLLTS